MVLALLVWTVAGWRGTPKSGNLTLEKKEIWSIGPATGRGTWRRWHYRCVFVVGSIDLKKERKKNIREYEVQDGKPVVASIDSVSIRFHVFFNHAPARRSVSA